MKPTHGGPIACGLDATCVTRHMTPMLDVRRIQSKALKLSAKGDASKVNPAWQSRIRQILSALSVAAHPADLNVPGFDFHELKGDRKGTFAVRVTGNRRVTFQWDDDGPLSVDLEDYHGK